MKRLGGGGGIIYVPPDLKDLVNELTEKLNKEGGIRRLPISNQASHCLMTLLMGK
ncbi:hypothetical protein [Vulcanisaeta souniana]|uniref:hypothetical protein n=1 Tax=Vulcanisaeta souniana TaxID=164452 RepID=UPI001FB20218|nr:hypothetical protein [Vulcanisaeta souniana]